ncbi:DNA repair protein RecN (Recombination protein N) [Chryseolinea serpens]|uniref:DNA repair protein RecN n=1 Tax=Chryseolinea serpens TaxID=947013 RepID=A0A1M5TXR3_9BACT|nr:DNA repair protein RecN [Chryseolinea serpens]SHH55416.1 DNA repair protein RecN (Recombination protein N) [Chryseolinea serpens]
MLKHITIQNYALIKHLELEPSPSLNVITGETGAGKSIMLGAIGLLMGNRADTKVLWDEEQKCIIEGSFAIKEYKLKSVFKAEDLDYDEITVIRREISPGGKSRAFINDTPVTLEVMKRIGNLLMDIHSQHETLQLGQQSFQLRLIDAYAANHTLREQYATDWQAYVKARKDFENLSAEADTLRQEADYVRFQLDELNQAHLEEGEQETLESEVKVMDHTSEIKSSFNLILDAVTLSDFAARVKLSEARAALSSVSSYSPAYAALLQRLESVLIELDDIMSEIESEEEKIEFDPQHAEFAKERLSTIYKLLKKHKAEDLKTLLAIQESLSQKDALTSNLDESLERAKQDFEAALKVVTATAKKLTDSRTKVFIPLCKQLTALLQELGIPNATLQIDMQPAELSAQGADRIDILFSANKGVAPRPLAQVASGGEFSRLMFSIKYVMAEKTAMPTLILDEIDTGISGEVAMKLGTLMKTMATRHQLIAISHLPQIAAKGDAHYFVYKDNTSSKTISAIKVLSAEDRVQEIAKMIGGAKPSKVALENAQELLGR